MEKRNFRLMLNLCLYLNVIILNLFISNYGLENTNGIWVISPYFFLLIYISYFKMFDKKGKIYYGLLFILKLSIIIVGYISGKYALLSINQSLFLSLTIVLIFVSQLLEYLFFFYNRPTKEYLDVYKLPSLSSKSLRMIHKNDQLKELLKAARNMIFKLHFNTFGLNISYALVVMSIIFQSVDITKTIGITLVVVSVLLCGVILFYFYLDFINNKIINKVLGITIIIVSAIPFVLYAFPNIVIEMKNSIIFVLLALFSLPFWYLHNKESKKLWSLFTNEHEKMNDQNNQ